MGLFTYQIGENLIRYLLAKQNQNQVLIGNGKQFKNRIMKNIHILPTYKPSNLVFEKLSNRFYTNSRRKSNTNNLQNQNIYITSDEEIKEGDWFYNSINNNVNTCNNPKIAKNLQYKKIILTTDQDLIADGVQSIDDEFLEWFINNPSCDSVDVVNDEYVDLEKDEYIDLYKIIIPQEEPKQTDENGKPITYWGGLAEPKKETLEEAAEIYASHSLKEERQKDLNMGFKAGTKWQAERMYSEEDIQLAWEDGRNGETECIGSYPFYKTVFKNKNFNKWFEQFKKK